MTFTIRQNDTSPDLSSQLRDDGVPIDLTGVAEVQFHMENEFSEVVVDRSSNQGNVLFEDKEMGRVAHVWEPKDTEQVGTYRAEWQVNFGTDSNPDWETFPTEGAIIVEVTEEIA